MAHTKSNDNNNGNENEIKDEDDDDNKKKKEIEDYNEICNEESFSTLNENENENEEEEEEEEEEDEIDFRDIDEHFYTDSNDRKYGNNSKTVIIHENNIVDENKIIDNKNKTFSTPIKIKNEEKNVNKNKYLTSNTNSSEKKSFFSDIKKGFNNISRNSNSKYSDEIKKTKISNKRNTGNTTIFVKFNISQITENILGVENR